MDIFMTKASVAAIISGLNDAGVKYLVVGGLAVNAHGYVRLTLDVDLIVGFEQQNLLAGMQVFKNLGYTPKVPVEMDDFADAAKRNQWHVENGAKVFAMRSDIHRETDIYVFITDPLGFDVAYERAKPFRVAEGLMTTVCAYDDLVKLKLAAGLPKDLLDLQQLRKARGEE